MHSTLSLLRPVKSWILAVLVGLLFGTSAASAKIEVLRSIWGFEGDLLPKRMGLLSVEVINRGSAEFNGQFILDSRRLVPGSSGGAYAQEIFLAGGQRRWIQFVPYIDNSYQTWQLSWGLEDSHELPKITFAPASTIMLADPDGLGVSGVRMKIFPEAAFPPTVSALEGLEGVVLDHVPRWDVARRIALLDWVKRGGILNLVIGMDGKHPEFSDELAPLNNSAVQPVGSGRVIRHNIPASEITANWLKEHGQPEPHLIESKSYDYERSNLSEGIASNLSAMVKPNIAWGPIYLLTILYIIIIGPLYYFTRNKDYRILIGAFFCTVILFSWILIVIGRRGYGESQLLNTCSVARILEPGRCDASQWINAFATKGGIYQFQKTGESGNFATSNSGESARCKVIQGKDGRCIADIPLFSSQPFFFRGVIQGPTPDVKVSNLGVETGLQLEVNPQFPREGKLQIFVRLGDRYTEMSAGTEGTWRVGPAQHWSDGDEFLKAESWGVGRGRHYSYRGPENASSILPGMVRGAMAYAEGVDLAFADNKRLVSPPLPANTARVFIYASAPANLRPSSPEFASGGGYVLYVQDVPTSQP